MKWLQYRPYPGKFLYYFREQSEEIIFVESTIFCWIRNSGLQACNVKEKETVSQQFLSTSRKVICSNVFGTVVGCRL